MQCSPAASRKILASVRRYNQLAVDVDQPRIGNLLDPDQAGAKTFVAESITDFVCNQKSDTAMPTEADPIIRNWYCQRDKGQRFRVVAIDEDARTIETQDFEGTVTEYDFDTWYEMNIEPCEAPISWAGAEDIGTVDDYGTEVTDTKPSDWNAPAEEFTTEK